MIDHPAALVESFDDAMHSERLDGIILSWDAAAEKLYGWAADEIAAGSPPRDT